MGRSFEFYYVLFYHTCRLIMIEINFFAKNKLKFKCDKSRFHSNYCYLNYYVQLELSDVTRYNLQSGWLHQCLLDTIIRGCICSLGLVQQNLDMHLVYKVYGIFSHKDHCPRIYISPKLIILLNPQKIFPQTLMKAQYVEQQCGKIVRFIIYGIYIMDWCCTLCIYIRSLKSILVFDLIYILQFSSEKASLTQPIIASIYNNIINIATFWASLTVQASGTETTSRCVFKIYRKGPRSCERSPSFVLYNISGDYRAEQCNGPNCINCLMENPSCEGYGDGENHHSSKPGSPWRMECYKGRLLGTFLADLNQD